MFLRRTVEDLLEHVEANTEIIVVLDGKWADPPIKDHPRVTIIYHPKSIGQRAATNEAARLATGKYVLKCDAHCAFDQGFDVKLMADMQDDITIVPTMRNLHAFSWICKKCGDSRYQGRVPTSCPECDNTTDFERDVVWIAKTNPASRSYRFDTTLKFQYFREFNKRPEGKGELTESMSLQGSCFMLTRDKYFELNICDESWGSWGQQGTEVACKTWLSGGRVIVSHKTYYAHLFRTQGGSFGFPYPLSKKQTNHARKCSQDLFLNNKWDKQIYPLSWLIERFRPLPAWHDESGKVVLERITKAGALFSRSRLGRLGV